MRTGPDIAETAALLGDPARANMLLALLSGQALTASELAEEGGVTRSTASTHLARLEAGGLLVQMPQGRHRYFRLAGPEVGEILERLMALSARVARPRTRPGPREPEMREARVCYDHLAGATGVRMLDSLVGRGLLSAEGDALNVTPDGADFFRTLDLEAQAVSRRPLCRACLDWSERRHHLAGTMGARLLNHIYDRGLGRRVEGTRVVRFTPRGRTWFDATFPPAGAATP